ncbi:hypothetical protein EDM57_21520 [Brevibacillus gelatini]|uniref:Uncharacterized protein n=1 Tax=Brevibacillus gelatini TaxID=1655277 RepID=A0A3M8AN89_9BACL|nr:hypothetical protein EDM57_21520 [Brevibacillus gelatini]
MYMHIILRFFDLTIEEAGKPTILLFSDVFNAILIFHKKKASQPKVALCYNLPVQMKLCSSRVVAAHPQ